MVPKNSKGYGIRLNFLAGYEFARYGIHTPPSGAPFIQSLEFFKNFDFQSPFFFFLTGFHRSPTVICITACGHFAQSGKGHLNLFYLPIKVERHKYFMIVKSRAGYSHHKMFDNISELFLLN